MQTAELAAVVEDSCSATGAVRLARLLDFLGITCRVFKSSSDFVDATVNGSLRGVQYAILAPLCALDELLSEKRKGNETFLKTAHSVFSYTTEETARCSEMWQTLINSPTARLAPLQCESVDVRVSKDWPNFTGPMHGLELTARVRSGDHVLTAEQAPTPIIDSPAGALFVCVEWQGLRIFINSGFEIVDLDEPLKAPWYDVKEHFLSAVPLQLYLKWAFQDSCWQVSESGACLILDDPLLKMRYGCCDFRQLEGQMREQTFSTNIAFIPWNWRRTANKMARLIRGSQGRYSISVHGCDHTRGEFATRSLPVLHRKTLLAKRRMERHREKTGIRHDLIMVFPQGAFSPESLGVLQQHQFLAAVNTEVFPKNSEETFTIKEAWRLAILKYGSFPLFSRRYPAHGLENFAFDLLLGKPCLIVEHHRFCKEGGREVVRFIKALNSLNCRLRWRSLGDVIRRSYQWRMSAPDVIEIRMFANELLLTNESDHEQSYRVEKADCDSVGVKEVRANGTRVQWETHNSVIIFTCKLGPGADMLFQVEYHLAAASVKTEESLNEKAKIALRRYASEFRDNVLSQHDLLLFIAQRAKKLLGGR